MVTVRVVSWIILNKRLSVLNVTFTLTLSLDELEERLDEDEDEEEEEKFDPYDESKVFPPATETTG